MNEQEDTGDSGTKYTFNSEIEFKDLTEKDYMRLLESYMQACQERDVLKKRMHSKLEQETYLTQEKDLLATEKQSLEDVCLGFQEEAEKTIMDYNELTDKYKEACKERDEFRMKSQNTIKTLSKLQKECEKKMEEMHEQVSTVLYSHECLCYCH